MKKCSILLVFLASVLFVWTGVYANNGDKVGEILHTDIGTYINHVAIPSYAYDGGTVVVAEDLRHYGFHVEWDEAARAFFITPNRDMHFLEGMGEVVKYQNDFGKRFTDALQTDIITYLNGTQIPSYSMGGYLLVKLEDLAPVGEFTWDASTRSAKLWIDWAGIADYTPVTIVRLPAVDNQLFDYIGQSYQQISDALGYYTDSVWLSGPWFKPQYSHLYFAYDVGDSYEPRSSSRCIAVVGTLGDVFDMPQESYTKAELEMYFNTTLERYIFEGEGMSGYTFYYQGRRVEINTQNADHITKDDSIMVWEA